MRKKFVKVGFEFTASRKVKTPLNSKVLIPDGRYELEFDSRDRNKLSKYGWINKGFTEDTCGCEVPTPIITKYWQIIEGFKQFKSFVDVTGLTIDLDKARCGLGGCHIHIDTSYLSLSIRKQLLKNIAIYLTNNPWLNWGFNDYNDNYNANSLLTEFKESDLIFSESHNILYSVFTTDYIPSRVSPLLANFLDNKAPLNAFLSNPTRIALKKRFAMRYNSDYKTVELRIFDMPKTLKQHLLHYEVAMAIYNKCLDMAIKKKTLKLVYNHKIQYSNKVLSEDMAVTKFKECMKELGINTRRTSKMVFNIRTRYAWSKWALKVEQVNEEVESVYEPTSFRHRTYSVRVESVNKKEYYLY